MLRNQIVRPLPAGENSVINPLEAYAEIDRDCCLGNIQFVKENIERLIYELDGLNLFSWADVELPDTYMDSQHFEDLVQLLLDAKYLLEEIPKYLSIEPEGQAAGNETKQDAGNRNSITRTGDFWEIQFNGRKALFRDLEQLRYIIHLVNNPNKEFYPTELRKLVKQYTHDPDEAYQKMGKEQLEVEGVSLEDLPIETLTKEQKDIFEEEAHKIWDNLNAARSSGDPERISDAEKKWENLKRFFLNEYGFKINSSNKGLSFDHYHRLPERPEKDRVNITQQIRNALKRIKGEIPLLYEHLSRYIKTGNRFSYSPDPEGLIDWEVTF